MQLIEVTDFGVRSAQVWLKRSGTPLRFVLFPMVHLGTSGFYAEVSRRLADCQVIVMEGVSGRSAVVSALTAVYRIPGRRRGELMAQALNLPASGAVVINPDVNAAGFRTGWRRVPFAFRLAVLLLAPLLGIWLAVAGPKRVFWRSLETDDLPSREEVEAVAGGAAKLQEAMVDDRDQPLLRCLDGIHQSRSHEAIDVAIVYGATHMRAVVEHLGARQGYWATGAEWITVLPF
ncbi:MAG: hypothetical protein J2P28_25725 [Actinobacteria bacterium]|nr:hypothetical protein [Actinomycetota bacterium]